MWINVSKDIGSFYTNICTLTRYWKKRFNSTLNDHSFFISYKIKLYCYDTTNNIHIFVTITWNFSLLLWVMFLWHTHTQTQHIHIKKHWGVFVVWFVCLLIILCQKRHYYLSTLARPSIPFTEERWNQSYYHTASQKKP